MSLATLSPSSYVFLGLFVAVYIFIIVDRICKCFEHFSMNKSCTAMCYLISVRTECVGSTLAV